MKKKEAEHSYYSLDTEYVSIREEKVRRFLDSGFWLDEAKGVYADEEGLKSYGKSL